MPRLLVTVKISKGLRLGQKWLNLLKMKFKKGA